MNEIGSISIRCENCDSDQLLIPEPLEDDAVIRCATCGSDVATVAEARAGAEQAARDALPDIAKLIGRKLGLK